MNELNIEPNGLVAEVLKLKDAQLTGIGNPDMAGSELLQPVIGVSSPYLLSSLSEECEIDSYLRQLDALSRGRTTQAMQREMAALQALDPPED